MMAMLWQIAGAHRRFVGERTTFATRLGLAGWLGSSVAWAIETRMGIWDLSMEVKVPITGLPQILVVPALGERVKARGLLTPS